MTHMPTPVRRRAVEHGRVSTSHPNASTSRSAPDSLPDWVVLHVPHDSTEIPEWTRPQFAVDDAELARELGRLTDHHTFRLYAAGQTCACVRAQASRIVVDVERFVDDEREPMARRGLGVIYERTSNGERLRHALDASTRTRLLAEFYVPHHARLASAVDRALAEHGRCLVIDCHSFPRAPLPFEERSAPRPDICIGTDSFHTAPALRDAFVAEFKAAGWSVEVDRPFSGALVPLARYRRDPRVSALMVEVQRALYMDETSLAPLPGFDAVSERVQRACVGALEGLERSAPR